MQKKYYTKQSGPICFRVKEEIGNSYDDAINKGMRDLVKADTKKETEMALRKIYFGEVYKVGQEILMLRDITEFANEALQAVHMNGSHGRHPLISGNNSELEERMKDYHRTFHPTAIQQISDGNVIEGLRHLYHDFFTGRYNLERKFA